MSVSTGSPVNPAAMVRILSLRTTAPSCTALPDMYSILVAVVVPARGVRAESPKWIVILSVGMSSTSAAIWVSADTCPAPMSWIPILTTTLPSCSNPIQAEAVSLSQTSLPYDCMLEAIPRPTRAS